MDSTLQLRQYRQQIASACYCEPRAGLLSRRIAFCFGGSQIRNTRTTAKNHGSPLLRWRLQASAGNPEDDQMDFAVLRMTLGIPGFDERQLPRVVAGLCLILLFANQFGSPGSAPPGQGRVETIALVLAAACFALPVLGKRLTDAQAGRSQAASSLLTGSQGRQLFALHPSLDDTARQELAWISYTLLRNTGSCSLMVFSLGRVWLARGTFAAIPETSAEALPQLSQEVDSALAASQELTSRLADQPASAYLPDRGALQQAGVSSWSFLPSATQTVLLQRLQPLSLAQHEDRLGQSQQGPRASVSATSANGTADLGSAGSRGQGQPGAILLLASAVPRALSRRERLWAAAIAAKVFTTLQTSPDVSS